MSIRELRSLFAARAACALAILAAGSQSPAGAESERLIFALDKSGSMQAVETRRVLDAFAYDLEQQQLPALPEPLTPWDVEYLTFASAEDVVSGAQVAITLPRRNLIAAPAISNEFTRLFRSAKKTDLELRDLHESRADAAYAELASKRLEPIVAAIRGFDVEASAPRTCLYAMLERLRSETRRTRSIVLSDGAEMSCGPTIVNAAAGTAHVVVVLVPGARDSADALVLHRRRLEAIAARFPDVVVVPSFRVRSGWLASLLTEASPANQPALDVAGTTARRDD